jgi:hypothetical protein
MKDLLKEAIADAKAVRETALANAKLALEEAFTPRLQSMLSAKLAEEMEEEDDSYEEPEETDTDSYEEPEETDVDTAPEGEEDSYEEPVETDEGMEPDDLDLESIIRELESEEETDVEPKPEPEVETEPDDEDIDINEIIRSLREEEEEEEIETEGEEPTEEDSSEELKEAYDVIRFLKGKINEVNLLNAKLLYSNKLFRNFSLNEGQKMKVIENFDRAHNLREVKLVYSTLAEGFKMPSTKKVVKESFASKPIASTRPARQVLSEGEDLAARFKKLAGLK